MANVIETTKNYLGSVANRTIGRAAWQEAMQPQYRLDDTKPFFQRIDQTAQAVTYFAVQFLGPATYESIDRIKRINEINKWGFIVEPVKRFLPALVADLGLIYITTSLSHNPLEFVAWKLAANAGTHMALDLGSTAVNRIRHSRPTNPTTLAV